MFANCDVALDNEYSSTAHEMVNNQTEKLSENSR